MDCAQIVFNFLGAVYSEAFTIGSTTLLFRRAWVINLP